MLNVQKYQTHDNGGRPFDVEIRNITQDKFIVKVTTNDVEIEESQKYSNVFYASQVFIGKSPLNEMTECSGEYGESFDGNTILIKTNLNEYVFIGNSVFSFDTNSPVISYVSPVGNNDVPYPYAVLENGNVYLMMEDVILVNTVALKNHCVDDPYHYYYHHYNITPDIRGKKFDETPPEYFSYYRNIRQFKIGGDTYTMTYNGNPGKNYDRYKSFEDSTDPTINVEILLGSELSSVILTRDMYIDIVESFGIFKGFRGFTKTILCERIW